MGFFKKIFKKVKKGFKSIGKGIKSVFKKFGKFMNKIGIVGQLALMFTPIGPMMGNLFTGLGNAAGGVFSKVTGALAQGGKLAQGAGKLLEAGASFAKAGHSAFRTISDGIGSFVSEFSKTALKKIPGMENLMPSLSSASDNFFTKSNVMVDGKMVNKSAWSTVQDKFLGNTKAVTEAFKESIDGNKLADAETKARIDLQKTNAQTGSNKVTPNAGPLKGDYKFPTDGTTGPNSISEIAGLDNVDAIESLKNRFTIEAPKGPLQGGGTTNVTGFNPNQSLMGEQVSPAMNPLTDKPYNLSNKLTTKATENVVDSPKGYFGELFDNAKDSLSEGIENLKNKPVETLLGKDPIAKGIDNFSNQFTSSLAQRAAMGKPKAAQVHNAYVPEFSIAPAGSYGSPEINDRAMQIQLGGTDIYQQLSYGAGASFYLQQMQKTMGGRG